MFPNDRRDVAEYVLVAALVTAVCGLVEWGLRKLPGYKDDHETHFHFHEGPEEIDDP